LFCYSIFYHVLLLLLMQVISSDLHLNTTVHPSIILMFPVSDLT